MVEDSITFQEAKEKLIAVEFSLDSKIQFIWEFISEHNGNLTFFDCEKPHKYYASFELKKHVNSDMEIILTCHGFSLIFPEVVETNRVYFDLNKFVQFLRKSLTIRETSQFQE